MTTWENLTGDKEIALPCRCFLTVAEAGNFFRSEGLWGTPSTRLMHHFFFLENPDCIKSYYLYDLGKKPRLKLCWSILTHWDSFLAVLTQDSLTAVNFVTLIWWTLFLAPPAYKVLPSIYLNHPLPWSKAAKRSRSMFDAWDSSQKLRLGLGRFTQALHEHFYWYFLSLSSVLHQVFYFIWLIFVLQVLLLT